MLPRASFDGSLAGHDVVADRMVVRREGVYGTPAISGVHGCSMMPEWTFWKSGPGKIVSR